MTGPVGRTESIFRLNYRPTPPSTRSRHD